MANVNGGAIQKAQTEKSAAVKTPRSMKDLIVSMEGQIAKALPSVITPERFTRMVLTAMSTNKELGLCTPNSFLGAMMQAAQLGVEPNTPLGQAYLIPYKNKGTLECSFQLGYKGLIDLAYRSGEVKDIQAHEVHENDTFEYELGLEPKLKHIPAMKNRGAVIMYYAIFHTKDGGYGFNVMSVDDVQEHARKYSKAYGSSFSPWKSNFDEMAKKTVLKRCLKYAPIKTEFARNISADETIKTTIAADMAEQADETDYIDAEVVEKDAPEVIEEKGRTVDAETGEVLELEAEEQA